MHLSAPDTNWAHIPSSGEHNSLGEAWLSVLETILERGHHTHDGPHRLMEVLNLTVALRAVGYDKLLRVLADPERIELMLRKYRSRSVVPPYQISYGSLFYDNDNVDQVEWAIRRLRAKPETKSATLAFHSPGAAHLSCISLLDFKYRNGRLDATAVYRSQNAYASLPGNVLAVREVQERVSAALEFPVGSFVLFVISAHIYHRDIPAVKAVLARASRDRLARALL